MTSCKCISPPGGGGRCNPGQFAVCRAEAGACNTTCLDIPKDVTVELRKHGRKNTAALLWVVSVLGSETDRARFDSDPIFREELGRGRFIDSEGLVVAKFNWPSKLFRSSLKSWLALRNRHKV